MGFASNKKFADAKNNGSGQYLLPGDYPEIVIDGFKEIATQNGDAVVVEITVVKSNVPECPPKAGYSYLMQAKHASYFSNVRRAVSELLGAPFELIDGEVADGCVSAAQPLEGTRASLRCHHKDTKTIVDKGTGEKGKYTVHTFRLIELSPKAKELGLDKLAA